MREDCFAWRVTESSEGSCDCTIKLANGKHFCHSKNGGKCSFYRSQEEYDEALKKLPKNYYKEEKNV